MKVIGLASCLSSTAGAELGSLLQATSRSASLSQESSSMSHWAKTQAKIEAQVEDMFNQAPAGTDTTNFVSGISVLLDSLEEDLVVTAAANQATWDGYLAEFDRCNTLMGTAFTGTDGVNDGAAAARSAMTTHHTCRGIEDANRVTENTDCVIQDVENTNAIGSDDSPAKCTPAGLASASPEETRDCLDKADTWVGDFKVVLAGKIATCDASAKTANAKGVECTGDQTTFEQAMCTYEERLRDACTALTTCHNAVPKIVAGEERRTQMDAKVLAERTLFKSSQRIRCFLTVLTNGGGGNDFASCKAANYEDSNDTNGNHLLVDYSEPQAAPSTCEEEDFVESWPGSDSFRGDYYTLTKSAWYDVEVTAIFYAATGSECPAALYKEAGAPTATESDAVANGPRHLQTRAGCPAVATSQGRTDLWPESTLESLEAAIRCCPPNGYDRTFGPGGLGSSDPRIKHTAYGSTCASDSCCRGTFEEANAICENAELVVCSETQLVNNEACGTGCGYDLARVWTSNEWVDGA